MCIILTHVESVSNTQIYVSSSKSRKRQLTIYTNKVDTHVKNAMILPVPNPLSVELLNFKNYKKIFDDCRECFHHDDGSRNDRHMYRAALSASFDSRPPLPVYTVGSYQASIVPSINDFDRVDTQILRVNPQVFTLLKDTYDSSFGFIICQLREGSHQYHPFAYTHEIHNCNLLFVPTLHYHLGETSVKADWDHTIYSPMTDLYTTGNYTFKDSSYIDWTKMPEDYRWPSEGRFSMNRHSITGYKPNKDLWIRNLLSDEHVNEKIRILHPAPSTPPSNPEDFLNNKEFIRNLRNAFH